jgi:hypothetical protein
MGLRPTGLSACIFFADGKKGYRYYPLRVAADAAPSAGKTHDTPTITPAY